MNERELVALALREGYSHREAKRFAVQAMSGAYAGQRAAPTAAKETLRAALAPAGEKKVIDGHSVTVVRTKAVTVGAFPGLL